MKCSFRCGFAAFAVVLAVAGPAVADDPKVSGGIEIGSRGCRAVVVQSEEAPWKAQSLNVFFETVVSTKLGIELARKGEISSIAATETAEKVKELFKVLTETYGLKPEMIYIAAGSSLADAQGLDLLKKAVKELVGKDIDVLTPAQEIIHAMKGLMPEDFMMKATYIDAGSNTVKYGVIVPGSANRLEEFRFDKSDGTVKFATAIRKDAKDKPFSESAANLAKAYEASLADMAAGNPGLSNRNDVLLSGGIVWAMVTISKPEYIRATHVRITAEDLARFRAILVKDEKKFPDVDTSKIAWPVLRTEADNEIQRVKDTFTMDQLIAGAEILNAMSRSFAFQNKKVYFTRQGATSWIASYAAEKAKAPAPK
jgi:hypothetical protein